MANIIVDLMQEIGRVENLPQGTLQAPEQQFAHNALRSARIHMAMNSYEGMRESLDDLREIGRPKKKEPES